MSFRSKRRRLDFRSGYFAVDLWIFAVEYKRVFTSSGIERNYTIWKFARWSYRLTTWRAG